MSRNRRGQMIEMIIARIAEGIQPRPNPNRNPYLRTQAAHDARNTHQKVMKRPISYEVDDIRLLVTGDVTAAATVAGVGFATVQGRPLPIRNGVDNEVGGAIAIPRLAAIDHAVGLPAVESVRV